MNAIKTRSMRSLSVLLVLLFSIFNLTAQSTATDRKDTTSSRDTAKVELPTSMARSVSEDLIKSVIHPSPQSAAYARYGEYPVNYSTGVPKIEIPLYTLNTGDYQLPISISYHASGIKVTDVSTPVGLGWVLTAGGVISRSSRAVSDRLNNNYNLFFHDRAQAQSLLAQSAAGTGWGRDWWEK